MVKRTSLAARRALGSTKLAGQRKIDMPLWIITSVHASARVSGVRVYMLKIWFKDSSTTTLYRTLGDIIPQKQLFCIIICLFKVLRTDAAANDRDHRQAHGIADNAADGVQVVGHRVGRNMHRAEQRDHRDDKHAAQLEQAVLKRGGDADVQNAFDRAALKAGDRFRRVAQLVVLPRGQRQNDARTDSAGDQRGHGDARDTHFAARTRRARCRRS